MDWCEDNGLDYVFGLSGNKLLAAAVEVQADDIRTRRALEQSPVLRGYTQTDYAAKSWKDERRVCARIEATALGLDIRFVVTNITNGSAEYIYDTLYCARGQMENLIKLHKSQLASPPPSKFRPMTSAPAALWNSHRSCEATPRQTTPPNPGKTSGASAPASKQPRWGSISASSSPTSRTDRPSISTTRSIARVGKWKI